MTDPTVDELIAIAKSADLPSALVGSGFVTPTFPARDGWKVVVFFDGSDFDNIEHFIRPDGTVLDPWDWPVSPERDRLCYWRPEKPERGGR